MGRMAKGQAQKELPARRKGRIKAERKSKIIWGGNTPVSPNTCWLCHIFCFVLRLLSQTF